jgi:DNA primase
MHNEKGELLGYAGRCIDGLSPDKYKLPAGFKKSLELYNLHRVKGDEEVVIVEGFFDCIRVYAAGYNCVALMGSTLSETQYQKLTRFKRVILFLDGDPPGRTASAEITLKLAEATFVRNANPSRDKQPDMLSPKEIQELLFSRDERLALHRTIR